MGTLDEFVNERAPVWTELEHLVDRAGNKPSKLGADGVRRLGTTLPRHRGRPRDRAPSVPRRSVAGSVGTTREPRAHGRVPLGAPRWDAARLRRARLLAQRARADRPGCDRGRLPLRSRAARWLLGVARPGRGRWSGAVRVPVRERAAHARAGLGRFRRRPGCVLERDLHEQHPRRDRRVRRAGSCSASARCTC